MTPRTDREIWWVGFKPDERLEAVWADFARDLEKENAELETTLKLVYDANQRGIKAWQQAHPDKAMVWADQAKLVEWLVRENAALRADKQRLDFLATLTGSGWACLHLNRKGTNDDWFLTRKQIDRRMATEPEL